MVRQELERIKNEHADALKRQKEEFEAQLRIRDGYGPLAPTEKAIARTVVAGLTSQSGWASRSGPMASFQIPYYTHYFERRLIYALAAFFIRAGVLTYYLRLFPRALQRLRGTSWVLLVLSFLQCAQLCIEIGVYCDDITDLYKGKIEDYFNPHCSDAYGFTYSGAIGDAAIDAMIYREFISNVVPS